MGTCGAYGFRWQEPDETEEPLQLDPLAIGGILHATLERAVSELELAKPGGFGNASGSSIVDAVGMALNAVAREWERTRPVPPPVIWERKLHDIRTLAVAALGYGEHPLAGQRSWAEIPFGGDLSVQNLTDERRALLPWDPTIPVVIPGTTVVIGGSIDRLDLDEAGDNCAGDRLQVGKAAWEKTTGP